MNHEASENSADRVAKRVASKKMLSSWGREISGSAEVRSKISNDREVTEVWVRLSPNYNSKTELKKKITTMWPHELAPLRTAFRHNSSLHIKIPSFKFQVSSFIVGNDLCVVTF